jgi:Xaa-Pro aminopeptidase
VSTARTLQSFDDAGSSRESKERIGALRRELAARSLAGYIVPRADEHQNEYVPPSAERLLWLTGFSGSAGLVAALAQEAALFVDGRYTLQAPEQVDGSVVVVRPLHEEPPAAWLLKRLKAGDRIGYDPWLFTPDALKPLANVCAETGAELVAVEPNLVDAVWTDRPRPPQEPIVARAKRYAGESAAAKLARIRDGLGGADGILLSDAHNVAWAFNLRGSDIAHTPIPLAFAYVPSEGRATIFADAGRVAPAARKELEATTDFRPPGELGALMADLGATKQRLAFDSATAPAKLVQTFAVQGGRADVKADAVSLMKARKNAAEIEGAREAHRLDAAALARFLSWFDGEAPKGKITEIDAALALEGFRRDTGALKDLSFPTIAGAGPHAAIPHYRVSRASNLKVTKGLFLIDSGAQYEAGTTDITRTIVVGAASKEMRDRFTRVLKGHIAIARAVFPQGASGAQLDAFARRALWEAGLDFDHGVGHGVGVYLSVHEGPQRIAKTGTVALQPGMIVSNEPGFYAAGRYGIRTENLVLVEARAIKGGERPMLGFETLSFAPIDRRAIEPTMLTPEERGWLDAYHAKTRALVSPHVDAKTRAWLKAATAAL